jgi:hypothetical protein
LIPGGRKKETSPTPSKSSIPFADDDDEAEDKDKAAGGAAKAESPLTKATPLLAITHPSVDSDPELPALKPKAIGSR